MFSSFLTFSLILVLTIPRFAYAELTNDFPHPPLPPLSFLFSSLPLPLLLSHNCIKLLGNQGILTHDFLHRIHMEIFEMNYYPPELTDWWMDDWMSMVYGRQRTFKASTVEVLHHVKAHGQRYLVDRENELKIDSLVKRGVNQIKVWMTKHGFSSSIIQTFENDQHVLPAKWVVPLFFDVPPLPLLLLQKKQSKSINKNRRIKKSKKRISI